MKRAVYALTALLVAGSAGAGFLPLAQAAPVQQTLFPTLEAWYQPDPTCPLPTGCQLGAPLPVTPPVPPPSTSPYPAGTMHVGWSGATETARAYLAFSIPIGSISAAALDVPLDTAPNDGDTQSSTAKVQACLVGDSIGRAEGSFAPPPPVDCRQHAALTYRATPSPHLTGDLKPLLAGLGGASGIALLPDAVANTGTDAWRVVFSAHDRADAAKTPPAVLTMTLDGGEDVAIDQPAQPPGTSPPLGGAVTQPGLGIAPAPAPALPDAVVVPAPAISGNITTALPQARTVRFGFQYPAVFLLPPVLLVLVPLAARALTRDLDAELLEPSA